MVIPYKPRSANKIKQCAQSKTTYATVHMTLISHLYKDSEEDDHNGSCDKEPFLWEVINEEDQGETDCSSQASVSDDELVSEGHSIPPKLVHDRGQQEDA